MRFYFRNFRNSLRNCFWLSILTYWLSLLSGKCFCNFNLCILIFTSVSVTAYIYLMNQMIT